MSTKPTPFIWRHVRRERSALLRYLDESARCPGVPTAHFHALVLAAALIELRPKLSGDLIVKPDLFRPSEGQPEGEAIAEIVYALAARGADTLEPKRKEN